MNDIPTPRTTLALYPPITEYVEADFARILERELFMASELVDEWIHQFSEAEDVIYSLRKELEEIKNK